jgi:hypothetical protein
MPSELGAGQEEFLLEFVLRPASKESRPADLVAGEAAVLGSCRGARPSEGTDTWHMNGLGGRRRLRVCPVRRGACRDKRQAFP